MERISSLDKMVCSPAPMQIWDQLKQPGYVRSLFAMLCGVTLGIVSYLFSHSMNFHHSMMDKGQAPSSNAPAFVVLWHIQNVFLLAVRLPWVLAIFLYFAWQAVQLRNKEGGWMTAFFAAFLFVSILRQLIQKF